jgi:hypothetical protein
VVQLHQRLRGAALDKFNQTAELTNLLGLQSCHVYVKLDGAVLAKKLNGAVMQFNQPRSVFF